MPDIPRRQPARTFGYPMRNMHGRTDGRTGKWLYRTLARSETSREGPTQTETQITLSSVM